jgi:hypothetical protein
MGDIPILFFIVTDLIVSGSLIFDIKFEYLFGIGTKSIGKSFYLKVWVKELMVSKDFFKGSEIIEKKNDWNDHFQSFFRFIVFWDYFVSLFSL